MWKHKSSNWSARKTKKPFTCPCQIAIIQSGHAHLTCCGTTWHFCRTSDRRKVERLQERALTTEFNSKLDSYDNLLKQTNLTTLYNRKLQDIARLIFKAKSNLLPKYVQDFYNTSGGRKQAIYIEELRLYCAPF